MRRLFLLGFLLLGGIVACQPVTGLNRDLVDRGGIGSRVFVVERSSETLAVYDFDLRRIVGRVSGLGNLQHATMTFSRDLRYGFVSSRSGKLTRIDLATLERAGEIQRTRLTLPSARTGGMWQRPNTTRGASLSLTPVRLSFFGALPRRGTVSASRA